MKTASMAAPGAANDYLCGHVALICDSYRRLTGRDLHDPRLSPGDTARELFAAPFALLSHNNDPDPLLTYANRVGLELFELDWDALLLMPSRYTAEAPNRQARADLLARVSGDGFIDDYSGVRISSSGRRFLIEGATVWNLIRADGSRAGQAACFSDWTLL